MTGKFTIQIKKEVPVNLNKKRLQKLAEKCLKILRQRKRIYEISLVFLSPAKIRSLNRQYRQINQITDVLSFVAGQDQYFKAEPGHQYLGDIMICPPVAKKQAKIYGQAAIIEIERLFVHGLLHLFNYDHQTNQEAKQMEQIETRILEGYD